MSGLGLHAVADGLQAWADDLEAAGGRGSPVQLTCWWTRPHGFYGRVRNGSRDCVNDPFSGPAANWTSRMSAHERLEAGMAAERARAFETKGATDLPKSAADGLGAWFLACAKPTIRVETLGRESIWTGEWILGMGGSTCAYGFDEANRRWSAFVEAALSHPFYGSKEIPDGGIWWQALGPAGRRDGEFGWDDVDFPGPKDGGREALDFWLSLRRILLGEEDPIADGILRPAGFEPPERALPVFRTWNTLRPSADGATRTA